MEFSRPEYEMGSLSLLQGIFPTQGLNPGLPYYRQILYQLSHKGSPRILEWAAYPFSSRPSRPYAFPVVMDGCESWTVKKTEHWRINAFELWCWRRLLRVPWTARRSNQSILKKISPEYSLEGMMLKLKLQYFGHRWEELTHWKRPWCWERLKAGGEGDDRGWDSWMASPTQWTWVFVNSGSCWWTGRAGVLQSMGSQRVRPDWATELK